MDSTQKNHIYYRYLTSMTTAYMAVVMLVLLPACSRKSKDLGEAIIERDSLATMTTFGVTSLISDSGVIRYRLNAEEWEVFERKDPPYWAFEKGIYLEKFDSLFQIDAYIEADTAYYYERKKLWELRGDVLIKNLQGDQIETQLLFWDQNTEKVYSDQYTKIIQEDKIIIGKYGFESNQQLTKYFIYNSEGIFPVEENTANDTIQSDTIQLNTIQSDTIQ